MRNVPSLETVYRDYSAKGVKFYYLYKALAHPGLNGYIRPHTLEERLMHIEEAKRTLGSEIPWLADSMENELRHAIGNALIQNTCWTPRARSPACAAGAIPKHCARILPNWSGRLKSRPSFPT